MKVSLDEIKEIFNDLIDGKKSREEVAAWAYTRESVNDYDDLEYDPPYEESRIWESLLYLVGVDLRDIDGSYLHSIENFIEFKREINIDV